MSENYNTRLPNDVADAFERFIDEKEISASEGGRRAIMLMLDDEGYLREKPDSEARTDGGRDQVTRPVLEQATGIAGIASLVAIVIGLAGVYPSVMGAVVALMAVLVILFAGALLTPLPEAVDGLARAGAAGAWARLAGGA